MYLEAVDRGEAAPGMTSGVDFLSRLVERPIGQITEKTLRDMHELVRRAKTDYVWIRMVTGFLSGIPSKDYRAEVARLFWVWHNLIWKRGWLRYQRDPHQVELVTSIWHLLDKRAGDCDDLSVLMAATVGVPGIPYRFVTMSNDPTDINTPRHVYAEAQVPDVGWMPLDLTMAEAYPGWEPPAMKRWYWPEPRY